MNFIPKDLLPARLVGSQEVEVGGSLEFILNAIVLTASAKSLPQSAITVSVRGMPMNAKKMQNILPQFVAGTTFPYPAR